MASPPIRLLLAYYLGGTPLFFLLDAAWGLSLRASFFDHLPARIGYYAFCLFCGVLAWLFPPRAPWVGLAESAVNITLVVVGFMAPILSLTGELAADPYATLAPPVTPEGLANFVIAGSVAWWSFQRRTLRL